MSLAPLRQARYAARAALSIPAHLRPLAPLARAPAAPAVPQARRMSELQTPKNLQTAEGGTKSMEVTSKVAIEQVRMAKTIEQVQAVTAVFAAANAKHGHVAFIKEALAQIDAMNLRPTLQTYDMLLEVFPKENAYKTRSLLDAIWPKDTLQSETAMHILDRMEANYIIPERSTFATLLQVFGQASPPVKKVRRMAYWMRRYAVQNPFAAPDVLPGQTMDVAKLALKRIAGPRAVIQTHQSEETGFVVCAHTDLQKEILNNESLMSGAEVVVHGPQYTWYCRERRPYFQATLMSAPGHAHDSTHTEDDNNPPHPSAPGGHGEAAEMQPIILGIMMAETSTKDAVVAWLRMMETSFAGVRHARMRMHVNAPEQGANVKEWSEPVAESPIYKVQMKEVEK